MSSEVSARTGQDAAFLLDGLAANPSPVLLIVGDQPLAAGVALKLHDGSAPWADRPARIGRLLSLDLGKIGASAETAAVLDELAGTDHWIFLPDVDTLLRTAPGQEFLDLLTDRVRDGDIAAVIASTEHDHLSNLGADVPRLMGFATVLGTPGDRSPGGPTFSRTLVIPQPDPTEDGWVVAVRMELTESIRQPVEAIPTSADSRLRLVDTIHLMAQDGRPPVGVVIGLKPDAFTVQQEEAAFASADLAARTLIGRPLLPQERITAVRAIFYA